MVYGILLESIIQTFILERYDKVVLEQVEEYVQHTLSNLNLFELYEDNLMIGIAEGMNWFIIAYSIVNLKKLVTCFSKFNFLRSRYAINDYLMSWIDEEEMRLE